MIISPGMLVQMSGCQPRQGRQYQMRGPGARGSKETLAPYNMVMGGPFALSSVTVNPLFSAVPLLNIPLGIHKCYPIKWTEHLCSGQNDMQ